MQPSKAINAVKQAVNSIRELPLEARIAILNDMKRILHNASPFKGEPVDCVLWVQSDTVTANDYNPNAVAPPEMKLLEHSIMEDGYTQPIVTFLREDIIREVVDGFHRNRIGKESGPVRTRILGYLPVVTINEHRTDRTDRIAATIRHNRARGKHQVQAMSDIVVELKRRNWNDERICRELGMEQDEVLRLCQITGLAELFSDQEFSKSWDVEGEVHESDFTELSDDISTYGDEAVHRTVNTSDPERIFHHHEKWECYKAGFYNTTANGKTKDQCEMEYKDFLSDTVRFESALTSVITEWKHSCEHYLTNKAMNRIAWLGQASACLALQIPSTFRGGFHLLTEPQQYEANMTALKALNQWLMANQREQVMLGEAIGNNQSELY